MRVEEEKGVEPRLTDSCVFTLASTESSSVCVPWTFNRFSTAAPVSVSTGCENIPVIAMENSSSCHQMAGNIRSPSAAECLLLRDNPAMFIF